MNPRRLLAIGAISGFLAVVMGAFGAHGLKSMVTEHRLANWETAARYQMYHAFALIAAAWVAKDFSPGWGSRAGWMFLSGTLVFSGSLYVLVLTEQKWLGAITPLGGLLFLAGWACLAVAAWAHPTQ